MRLAKLSNLRWSEVALVWSLPFKQNCNTKLSLFKKRNYKLICLIKTFMNMFEASAKFPYLHFLVIWHEICFGIGDKYCLFTATPHCKYGHNFLVTAHAHWKGTIFPCKIPRSYHGQVSILFYIDLTIIRHEIMGRRQFLETYGLGISWIWKNKLLYNFTA